MHDASSFIHLANVGADTSFQCIAIHLFANKGNSYKFELVFINFHHGCVTQETLGSVGMVSPVISLSTLSIDTQYELRQGKVQNICSNVPIPDLHLGQNWEY